MALLPYITYAVVVDVVDVDCFICRCCRYNRACLGTQTRYRTTPGSYNITDATFRTILNIF